MAELSLGNPDRLATDVGPVITAEAQAGILAHVEAMRGQGRVVHQLPLPAECRHGTFVPPTIIEIDSLAQVKREVFGPVLHVRRYRREALDEVLDEVNATGFGLTFGVHSRIDETISHVSERIHAGNIYVNRNLIGAVVGVQPFGGHGLSGTGPKAGGPLYLRRLVSRRLARLPFPAAADNARLAPARAWADLVDSRFQPRAAVQCRAYAERSPLGASVELPGPAGERNVYSLHARGTVLCMASGVDALARQVGAALATGNRAVILPPPDAGNLVAAIPAALRAHVRVVDDPARAAFDAVLFEGDGDALRDWQRAVARRDGPIVPMQSVPRGALLDGTADYDLEFLLLERVVSTNTAAAGGNANLMSIG
jgi:RHH-type proline utilization regulon transcriptional repressor/proline dehydrogenase/delta 1-pyrroline-5-carboxylate dehydrogenase